MSNWREMTDEEFLEAVRERVNKRWQKNGMASPNGAVCLLGAAAWQVTLSVHGIMLNFDDLDPEQSEAQRRLALLLKPVLQEQYPDRAGFPDSEYYYSTGRREIMAVVGFNDHKETTLGEVNAVIEKAIAALGG